MTLFSTTTNVARSLHVLLVRNAAFFGGAEIYSLRLVQGLKKRNISVTLWTNNRELHQRSKKSDINSERRYLGPLIQGKWSFLLFIVLSPFLFVYFLIVIGWLKFRKGITVLHLKSLNDFLIFTLVGKALNLKVVWTMDIVFYSKKNFLLQYLFVTVAKRADTIIALSDFMKKNIIEAGISPLKIVRIYNGVTPQDIAVPSWSRISSIKIGFIGKVSEEKGVFVFLEAAKKICQQNFNTEFWVIGAKNPTQKTEIEKYSFNGVVFKGWQENLSLLYRALDIVVVPSLVEESFGFVAAEAMSYGKVVIVSNRGALPELVQNEESGLIVPPNDINSLSEALLRVIKDPSKMKRLGENAHIRSRRMFTIENMIDKTINTYV